jgi:adenosylcobinamide kinase/adenosylcobinamide-phosphate guanylyltransferase
VEYVATGMPPSADDPEWAARVAEHQARRPAQWRTTETLDLEGVLRSPSPVPVLVDCLSLWLARVMDECGAWDEGEAGKANAALSERVEALVRAWRTTERPAVAVSNEVGSGVVPATASGRLYRDALGRLNATIADGSDEVWFCTAGLPRRLR